MDKIAGVVLVVLLLAPSAVNAGNHPPIVSAGYFGAGLGGTKVNVDSGDTVDETDQYLRIFGGVEINPEIYPHVNIEFGLIDFGEYSADESNTARASAVTAGIVGDGDLTEDLSIFFKLGLYFWEAEYEIEGDFFGPFSGSGEGNGNSNFGGVGLDYKLNSKLITRLEFETYKDVGKVSDVDLLGLAIIFMFE